MTYDVCAIGEVLIDFLSTGVSDAGMHLFERNPGGAPANVACAVARLGRSAAFIGKIGNDLHGEFLVNTLRNTNVETSGIVRDDQVFTTMAFVELNDSGERSFSFARKPGADTYLKPEELDRDILANTKILHFGSLSLTNEPARSATLQAIKIAKHAGAVITYDPNYRELLWDNKDIAVQRMRSVLSLVDMIKISAEETKMLTGFTQLKDAGSALLETGPACVAITLGKDGALIFTHDGVTHVDGFPCRVKDTTGAGDAFWGGFLYSFLETNKSLNQLTNIDACSFTRFANSVASLCIEKRGAITALPDLAQVQQRMQKS